MKYQVEYWKGQAGWEKRDESKTVIVEAETPQAALNAVVPSEYQVNPDKETFVAPGPDDTRTYTDAYFVEEATEEELARREFKGLPV